MTKSASPASVRRQYGALSAERIPSAIKQLTRRLAEIEAATVPISSDDALAKSAALATKINETYTDIYGQGRDEVSRYVFMPMGVYGRSDSEIAEEFLSGTTRVAEQVRTTIAILEERARDLEAEGPAKQPLKAYQSLELHPEIERAAGGLYANEHYANAIEDAVKALNNLVRMRSGIDAFDGSTLMERAFSPKKPVLAFNGLADESDREEQKGFMMMFSGAVAGLRNPRAHKLIKDDAERALEFIAFVSLLAHLIHHSVVRNAG